MFVEVSSISLRVFGLIIFGFLKSIANIINSSRYHFLNVKYRDSAKRISANCQRCKPKAESVKINSSLSQLKPKGSINTKAIKAIERKK